MKRAPMNPATEAEYAKPNMPSSAATHGPNHVASAWAIAARLQMTMAIAKPIRVPSLSMRRPARTNPMA